MSNWILIGTVCWLAYRQYHQTNALASRNRLSPSSAAGGATELLDKDGRVVSDSPSKDGLSSWLWLIAGILYVVCPLDFDFVPVLGWVDDIVVAYLAYKKWRQG